MKRKQYLIFIAVFIVVILGIGAVVVIRNRQSSRLTENTEIKNTVEGDVAGLRSKEEVAVLDLSNAEKMQELIQNAQSKDYFNKYQEALDYYEAALNYAADDEIIALQFEIYRFAERYDNTGTKQKYAGLLGQETIDRLYKEMSDREDNR